MKKIVLLIVILVVAGCSVQQNEPESASGVKRVKTAVKLQVNGLTVEQKNVENRLDEDNKIGSIKHFYVISAYSGQVIIYSTVKGKVTSSGKRLTPYSVESNGEISDGFSLRIGEWKGNTTEVLQDDGTYGHSEPYLYWWDTRGIYHQHYVSGGQIIHMSSQPLVVKGIIINMEVMQKQKD